MLETDLEGKEGLFGVESLTVSLIGEITFRSMSLPT